MNNTKFAYIEDCVIVRPDSEWEDMRRVGVARLCPNDEDVSYFDFPESFTDEQISVALDFANEAFAVGVEAGMEVKACQIRRALGVE